METIKTQVNSIPHVPGVYRYFDAAGTLLYVGKARDLKKRVSQYFQKDDVYPASLRGAIGPKTRQLVEHTVRIETTETVSEFDALMLEAQLIRTHQPKYNIIAKDDKSPIYLMITKEELPRLLLTRKPKLYNLNSNLFFGPFQSASVLRFLMRTIRHIVPYCTSKQRRGKACFYTHLGLCNPCPSVIANMAQGADRQGLAKQYQHNIRKIRSLFSGKSTAVLAELEQEMHSAAKRKEFEHAAFLKHSVDHLRELMEHHYSPHLYLQSDTAVEDLHDMELTKLREILLPYFPTLTPLERIECMDISNLQGTYATGSMVVLVHGRPDTSQYRRFRIRGKQIPNDVRMMAEVMSRRLKHDDWPTADLLIIDGGKPQVAAALQTQAVILSDPEIRRGGVERSIVQPIPIIGLAKRQEEIILLHEGKWVTLTIPLANAALHVVRRIRDEAHRFAITYHRLLRRKETKGMINGR